MRRMLVPVAALLLAPACSRQQAGTSPSPPQAAATVQAETLAPAEIVDIYEASGTVRARYTAAIAAKIAASIVEIRAREGDRVTAGQTLIVLDKRDLEANLRRAEAGRAEAQDAISETESAIAAARSNLELARVTHQRFADLLAKKSVSQQEFDESAARLQSAQAAVEMALSKRQQVEARRRQAEAEVVAANVAVGYAALAAPFAGMVTERRADPGSLATPGTPLLLIEQQGNLRLEAAVDESRLALVRAGESVQVRLDGLGRTVAGRVAEIVPSVDPGTRTLTAKIDLPAVAGLRAGMFGRAAFPAAKRSALLVPEAAVAEHGQMQSVFVAEGETARLRFVSLGAARDGRREVLAGLSPGEKIIVSHPPELVDGGRVVVREPAK
ncbi:MAG TPA: efflux RND transporter periplasmic adaptor subunit [Bryobacterales bacterium]|nr:efflux RND transporter periplasmic adaptor subunit [Bryobacterales bacterium]